MTGVKVTDNWNGHVSNNQLQVPCLSPRNETTFLDRRLSGLYSDRKIITFSRTQPFSALRCTSHC
ncbi:hypothetical protein CH063_03617 [Colletotrichum higginsianum]|uniref:Uncharacterized protein n=1 Tax=Colletotrichum higginsianum (strain IMI 349063) TaxID=759273 RepID=H1VZ19_COLHI|nr:hypothetical protein CH063_03617 [Colletotrichum higginsianum]